MAATLIAGSATAATLDFETDAGGNPLSPPTAFASTGPLTNEYQGLGVVFGGGGAILDQGSNFGVSGFSPTNFLAYNSGANFSSGGAVSNGDTMTFGSDQTSVSFYAATRFSATLTVEAFDAAANSLGTRQVVIDSDGELVQLQLGGIRSLSYVTDNSDWVLDDLTFDATPIDPVPGPAPFALLATAIAGLSVLRSRRG
ncbi:MAG: hypothetical protein V2I65_11880 [Paracoccaceae bacterium]|nr:hypothetical protein [Paracoccaceae bacterium]